MVARDTPNVEVHGSSPWSGANFFSKKPIETIGVRTILLEKTENATTTNEKNKTVKVLLLIEKPF